MTGNKANTKKEAVKRILMISCTHANITLLLECGPREIYMCQSKPYFQTFRSLYKNNLKTVSRLNILYFFSTFGLRALALKHNGQWAMGERVKYDPSTRSKRTSILRLISIKSA
jgi:hypothetical protein